MQCKKWLTVLTGIVSVSLVLSACTPTPTAEKTEGPTAVLVEQTTETEPARADPSITLTDALGRTVTFSKVPERIVLTGKALFMIADAIYLFPEAGSRIVALGDPSQGNSAFIPVIDPKFGDKTILPADANTEQIVAERPDVVILKSYLADTIGKPIEALGIPVVYLDFETPEQYQRDIMILGKLFDNEARAKEVAAFFQERFEKFTAKLSAIDEAQKPKTLLLYYTEKDGAIAFNVPPLGWMQTIMVQNAGGIPVWSDANPGQGWTKVNFEQIATWDADQIFIISYFTPVDDVVAKLKEDSQWASLRAAKDGKLYAFAGDLYSWDQPDTRWILGLSWLATKLQPDINKDIDIRAEAQKFFNILYGLDEEAFKKSIEANFTGDLP